MIDENNDLIIRICVQNAKQPKMFSPFSQNARMIHQQGMFVHFGIFEVIHVVISWGRNVVSGIWQYLG